MHTRGKSSKIHLLCKNPRGSYHTDDFAALPTARFYLPESLFLSNHCAILPLIIMLHVNHERISV